MVQKGKSFAYTFSPSQLNMESVDALVNWSQKQSFSVLVLENKEGGKLHAHGQIWCNDGRAKHKVKDALIKIGERTDKNWDFDHKCNAVNVKFAYNDDFVTNYICDNDIKTNDDTDIRVWNVPDGDSSRFYPTQEEQEAIKNKSNAVDLYMYELEVLYKEWEKDNNPDVDTYIWTVGKFLGDMMFKSRRIKVMRDPKHRKDLAKSLLLYIKKSTSCYNFMFEEDKELFQNAKQLEYTKFTII